MDKKNQNPEPLPRHLRKIMDKLEKELLEDPTDLHQRLDPLNWPNLYSPRPNPPGSKK